MNHKSSIFFLFVFLTILLGGCDRKEDFKIYLPASFEDKEWLAAKELRRYLYLRTDRLVPIVNVPQYDGNSYHGILLGTRKDRDLVEMLPDSLQDRLRNLPEEGYIIHTEQNQDTNMSILLGAGSQGLLFGAYRFIEKLGVRFYLHGDVIPDEKTDLVLPEISEIHQPRFTIRGILPFHDFPEGPDWWDREDYKHYIAQLPKLKMNFIGFHTYPESDFQGAYKAEPLVWIGEEDQISTDGGIKTAYPLLHFNTGDTTWGYTPKPTSRYSGGAAQVFDKDPFGPGYLPDLNPWPHSEQENINLVNHFGEVLHDSFTFAERLGVKTCIGTETPLTIPGQVYERLLRKYPEASQDSLIRILYRGIFQRIQLRHPLDFYWFWTPENWTWSDVSDREVEDTKRDLQTAVEVARDLGIHFTLATCGWVLGPPRNRAEFDDILPKNMPFSCINRYVGFARIEEAFNDISERPLWAIPWLEDDPGLLTPQLWAGRMRKDAYDAYKYGCNGLIGIHWRTRLVDPTLAALAQAGWDPDPGSVSAITNRDLPIEDFYEDWALHQFGPEKGLDIGRIFATLDGGPEFIPENNRPYEANLFRTSHWDGGPGAIQVIHEPWETVGKRFDFIDQLEYYRQDINGEGNLERFDYWLNTFRFARETARLGCLLGRMERIAVLIQAGEKTVKDSLARFHLLPLRIGAAETYNQMMHLLLRTVTNSSELGTIANLEQHNLLTLKRINLYDSLLETGLGNTLPSSTFLESEYNGPSRIIMQAPPGLLEKNSDLYLKIRILSPYRVKKVKLYWKEMGEKDFITADFKNVNRNVFDITLDKTEINNRDLEYYVEATLENGDQISYPSTARKINQTLIHF